MSRLSAPMQEALDTARQHGGLVRWPGGFWTYPGCAVSHTWGDPHYGEVKVPEWTTKVNTVKALVTRGLLAWSDHARTRGGGSFPVAAAPADR